MKKKNIERYSHWLSHLNNTKDRVNYSIRRMDLLIITISGAGIYIIFETLREFKAGHIEINNSTLLIWSGILLLSGIISNFISQITGFHANKNECRYINEELYKMDGRSYDKDKQSDYDCKVKTFNIWTNVLNIVSICFMFIGIVLLALFNYLLI